MVVMYCIYKRGLTLRCNIVYTRGMKGEILIIRLSAEEKARLRELAKEAGVGMSEYVLRALEAYIRGL